MAEKQHLLTTRQMAQFACDGFLRFDEIVPPELNALAMKQIEDKTFPRGGGYTGEPFDNIWHEWVFGKIFRLPAVQGIMHSLVGPNPRYDHHAVHVVGPNSYHGQIWHADAIIDTRFEHFDVQFFYYPHDTPREMGGTMFLPGSQFRRVNESDVARYHNFTGQVPVVCKAGTILVGHHNLWHCAQPNATDKTRYMVKLRLNPTVRQVRLWNTDDLNAPDITSILGKSHGWYGSEHRIESVQRVKFWRSLTGNDVFDMALWVGRIENEPNTVLVGR